MRIAGKEAAEEYRFTAWGHPGIKATHRTTLMLTKDADCTARGDCIIGVRADFDPGQLRELVKQEGMLVMAITLKQPPTPRSMIPVKSCCGRLIFSAPGHSESARTNLRLN